jgi:hypothetical protein
MDLAQRLDTFLASLDNVPWFSSAGATSTTYHVVDDAVVGWDDWSAAMMATWPIKSEQLEAAAQAAIGDAAIDHIFNRVAEVLEPKVRAGLRAYFARRPNTTDNTDCGADAGLWPDMLDRVLRDVSWAAVEVLLDRPEFYISLIEVYREGRWPCSWKGTYPTGTFVVL